MKILVTGGCGFIGSHLIKHLLKNKKNHVLNIDAHTYASMPESLNSIKNYKNYFFKKINICNPRKLEKIISDYKPNKVFHLAAESHVDNSINNPDNFISSNIIGTYNLLNICQRNMKKNDFKFIHISTDEVYGSIENKKKSAFKEKSKFKPNSPYSASKASSDLLVRAWNRTYDFPAIITNCVNNFGEWQYPEKLIPIVISSCLLNKKIPVYGKGNNIREWIYVKDHVRQLIDISAKGKIGETYNIGSGYELDNLSIVKLICEYFNIHLPRNKSYTELITFVKDRPAHDFRYALNTTKISKILNNKKNNFEKDFEKTIEWNIKNSKWLLKKTIKK